MDSLQIPESGELVHDCENCQALCCVYLKLDANKFPILQDKKAGTPCQNLDLVADSQNLFKCKIHDQLKADWKICAGYSCYGAGQEVSRFFSRLSCSLEKDELNQFSEFEHNIRKKNLEIAFVVLTDLFQFLKYIKKLHGEMAYGIAKNSIELEMELFSLDLENIDRPMYIEERDEWFRKFLRQIESNLKEVQIDIDHLLVDLFS